VYQDHKYRDNKILFFIIKITHISNTFRIYKGHILQIIFIICNPHNEIWIKTNICKKPIPLRDRLRSKKYYNPLIILLLSIYFFKSFINLVSPSFSLTGIDWI